MAAEEKAKNMGTPKDTIKEGKALINQTGNKVFYNEAMCTNRDISVAVVKLFLQLRQKEFAEGKVKRLRPRQKQHIGVQFVDPDDKEVEGPRVLEAMAASGLRSLRYALEVPEIARVDSNDLDPKSVDAIRANVTLNGEVAAAKVHAICSDARMLMLARPLTYDVVDLDPYGTPASLLDSAIQCVAEGGLLAVTATDMANLCGNNGPACWANYGCVPVHRPYCHEMALRILLACLEATAARYRRHIEPLLSLSVDYYVRVFVRVHTSPAAVKESAVRLSQIWQSSGCDSWWLQPIAEVKNPGSNAKYMPGHGPRVPEKCTECGSGFLLGGPIWAQPIHDFDFARSVLNELQGAGRGTYAQAPRLSGLLTSLLEELPDVPLYYNLHDICKTVRATPPKADTFRSALVNAGYRVSGCHTNPLALKTDAPPEVLWDIVRCWVADHPVVIKDPGSYAAALLAKPPQLQANFNRAKTAISKARAEGVVRFVSNPANWGPRSRHTRGAGGKNEQQGAQQGKEGEGSRQDASCSGKDCQDKASDELPSGPLVDERNAEGVNSGCETRALESTEPESGVEGERNSGFRITEAKQGVTDEQVVDTPLEMKGEVTDSGAKESDIKREHKECAGQSNAEPEPAIKRVCLG